MTDYLSVVEERKGQIDLGVIGQRIYEGARTEGASRLDALFVVAGFYLAAFRNSDTEAE